jgi:hypothetical protein
VVSRTARFIPLLALLYAPFIGGDLLTDDFVHFERLRSVSTIADVIAQPDAFRFYRPVTQASLAIELAVHGDRPPLFRAVNIALHAAVLAMALVVARLILVDSLSAALAALAFALTPKAPVIAVLWISGPGRAPDVAVLDARDCCVDRVDAKGRNAMARRIGRCVHPRGGEQGDGIPVAAVVSPLLQASSDREPRHSARSS